ncbi:MAG: hypothetical protein ABI610_13540, partial [Acidobacteriota bacterium]
RLDLVGGPRDQPCGCLQVRGRDVEPADGEVAVPAVAVELGLRGELRDPRREERDRVAVPAQVRQAAARPDERVRVLRLRFEARPGLREAGFPVTLRLRLERKGEKRLVEEGPGLRARRELGLRPRRRLSPRRGARGEKQKRKGNRTSLQQPV